SLVHHPGGGKRVAYELRCTGMSAPLRLRRTVLCLLAGGEATVSGGGPWWRWLGGAVAALGEHGRAGFGRVRGRAFLLLGCLPVRAGGLARSFAAGGGAGALRCAVHGSTSLQPHRTGPDERRHWANEGWAAWRAEAGLP